MELDGTQRTAEAEVELGTAEHKRLDMSLR